MKPVTRVIYHKWGKKKDLPKNQFEKNLQAMTPLYGIYTACGYLYRS